MRNPIKNIGNNIGKKFNQNKEALYHGILAHSLNKKNSRTVPIE